jgi:putative sigma-54 modulation protein
MQLEVTGRNIEVTEALRSYAERKLAKLGKQLHPEVPVEVHLVAEKNPSIAAKQVAEATVRLKGNVLHAKAAAPDMKAAIDELTEKLCRQVKETRSKRMSVFKRKARAE